MDLWLLHLVLLFWLSFAAADKLTDEILDRLLASLGLTWGNLLTSAVVLSIGGNLSNRPALMATSLGLAAGLFAITQLTASPPQSESTATTHAPAWLTTLSLLLLGALTAGSSYGVFVHPSSATLALDQPLLRALLQVDDSSIFALPASNPQLSSPTPNFGLLLAVAIVYHASPSFLNFVSIASWIAAGLAAGQLARKVGATPAAAITTSTLALLATPVFALAGDRNATIAASAALLAALNFGLDGSRHQRGASWVLAGLWCGLAAGTCTIGTFGGVALIGSLLVFPSVRPTKWWLPVPGLLLGTAPMVITLILTCAQSGYIFSSLTAATESTLISWRMLIPLWQTPNVLTPPRLETVSLGWAGLACLLAIPGGIGLTRAGNYTWVVRTISWAALVLLLGTVVASHWIPLGSETLAPGLLLATPALALLVSRGTASRPRFTILICALVATGALWSDYLYLMHNESRPWVGLRAPLVSPSQSAPLSFSRAELIRQLASLRPAAKAIPSSDPEIESEPSPGALYSENLILTDPTPHASSRGIETTEGPYPRWPLSRVRWLRRDSAQLFILPAAGVSQVKVSCSARLQLRPEGTLEVIHDGLVLQRIAFNEPLAWHDFSITIPVSAQGTVIELRDVPPAPVPDWDDYRTRYPDVRRYLELIHRDPIAGAREHYELSGRAEGRTVKLIAAPPTPADEHRFLFRRIQVEGFQ